MLIKLPEGNQWTCSMWASIVRCLHPPRLKVDAHVESQGGVMAVLRARKMRPEGGISWRFHGDFMGISWQLHRDLLGFHGFSLIMVMFHGIFEFLFGDWSGFHGDESKPAFLNGYYSEWLIGSMTLNRRDGSSGYSACWLEQKRCSGKECHSNKSPTRWTYQTLIKDVQK